MSTALGLSEVTVISFSARRRAAVRIAMFNAALLIDNSARELGLVMHSMEPAILKKGYTFFNHLIITVPA